jgi:hypothetical protein
MPHADLIDAVSAAHLAVAVAAVSGNPGARTVATAVRDCRLRSGVTTWPFTGSDYAQYEARLQFAAPPDPGRQLTPDVIAQIGELDLSHLLLPSGA